MSSDENKPIKGSPADRQAKATAAEERLREFIRANTSGGCKILSIGDDCTCPLCDLDLILDRKNVSRPVKDCTFHNPPTE